MSQARQSGLHGDDHGRPGSIDWRQVAADWHDTEPTDLNRGQVDAYLRRMHRLSIQFYGALSAFQADDNSPELGSLLATSKQVPDPDAVPDFSEGASSDREMHNRSRLLQRAFSIGVEDVERATEIALEAERNSTLYKVLYRAGERPELAEVALALVEEGEVSEAARLLGCGEQFVQLGCTCCGHDENTVPITCGSRHCPDCADQRLGSKLRKYLPVVRRFDNPVFGTLTIPNVPVSEAEDAVDTLVESFGDLRRRKFPVRGDGYAWAHDYGTPSDLWRSRLLQANRRELVARLESQYVREGKQIPWTELVESGIYAIDIKQTEDGDLNVHLHTLMDAAYIPKRALQKEWTEAVGADQPLHVDIRRCYGRGSRSVKDALMETIAYAAKEPEFEEVEDGVSAMVALKGRRLVQPFGDAHGNIPDVDGDLRCARCHQAPLRWEWLGIVDGPLDEAVPGCQLGDRPPPLGLEAGGDFFEGVGDGS